MSLPDIKRQAEMHICTALTAAVADHQFVPYAGGTLDVEALEPPCSIVSVFEAIRALSGEGTWEGRGTIQVITHASEVGSQAHSLLARRVYSALASIPRFSSPDFDLHGLDIDNMTAKSDDESQCHADVIEFNIAMGG